ncbi:MAG: response regulator transcription factor [Burkholderiales bacterium]
MNAMPADVPTVHVVDDDPSVLKGLSRLLRAAGWQAQTYVSPDEFVARHDPAAAGCLLLDVSMPGLNGLELHQRLREAGCPLPVIFITGHGDVPMSVRAMRAGALNFLQKPVHDEELLKAVAEAVEQDRLARKAGTETTGLRERLATLTPREREVLAHVVSGQLNKQIAADLAIVEKTIKVHRARVMEKMGAASLADLVRMAQKLGISAPD